MTIIIKETKVHGGVICQ